MNAGAVEAWLVARLRAETGEPVDAATPVYRYGVDSRLLAFVIEAAETSLGLEADLDRISPAETVAALAAAFAPLED